MTVRSCKPASRPLDAVVTLPGSKSITNRALVTAALATGSSRLTNLLLSDDTRLMLEAIGALGIPVGLDEPAETATIDGRSGSLPARQAALFCGNSGTTARFCTALAAVGDGSYTLDGVERMRERPIGGLVDALRRLGVRIEHTQVSGFLPLLVHAAGLDGGRVVLESPESSQLVSGLLLVAPYARRELIIEVRGKIPSRPYLGITRDVMKRFGVEPLEESDAGNLRYTVPAPRSYRGTDLAIEPDASNATYFLAAAAVAGGRVAVRHLGSHSIQGDARFVDLLERMGCTVHRSPDRLCVQGPTQGTRLRGIDVDLNDMPDTAQTLAVVALFAEGPTTIRNVASLRVKETDRIAALVRELTRLGASVEEAEEGLTVNPGPDLRPVAIDTYDDHRMAMSFAVAGLRVPGLVINDPGCCSKTFPDFFRRFDAML